MSWRDSAACVGRPLDLFFDRAKVPPAAKRLCASCPVRAECLEDALAVEADDHSKRYGIRGGLLSGERHKIHLSRKRAPATLVA